MPWNRSLYPKDWGSIARQVKDESGWTCENCGKQCKHPDEQPLEFLEKIRTGRLSECPVVSEYLEHPTRWVLTVAHLDHNPSNCERQNLRALCAPCHCRYDLSQMARKKRLKAEREGQLSLLD